MLHFNKRSLFATLKIFIALVTLIYILIKVKAAYYSNSIHSVIKEHNHIYLVLSVLLMPINWMLEALKWKFLLKKIESISLLVALKSTLAGIAVSLLTPNRIGEFAGRILYIKDNKAKASLISIFSGILQLSVTILAGSVAYLFISFMTTDKLTVCYPRIAFLSFY